MTFHLTKALLYKTNNLNTEYHITTKHYVGLNIELFMNRLCNVEIVILLLFEPMGLDILKL